MPMNGHSLPGFASMPKQGIEWAFAEGACLDAIGCSFADRGFLCPQGHLRHRRWPRDKEMLIHDKGFAMGSRKGPLLRVFLHILATHAWKMCSAFWKKCSTSWKMCSTCCCANLPIPMTNCTQMQVVMAARKPADCRPKIFFGDFQPHHYNRCRYFQGSRTLGEET